MSRRRLARSLLVALLVAVGVSWVMRRGLHPIETMAAQADRITAGDLTDRVGPHDPATEVGRPSLIRCSIKLPCGVNRLPTNMSGIARNALARQGT